MHVKKLIPEKDGLYFFTSTCARWLSLFRIADGYKYVYKWFDVLVKNGHYIIGYVIMPNHVHAIIAFRNTGPNQTSINTQSPWPGSRPLKRLC